MLLGGSNLGAGFSNQKMLAGSLLRRDLQKKRPLLILLVSVLIGLLFGFVSIVLLKFSVIYGSKILQANLSGDYAVGLTVAIFLTFIVASFPGTSEDRTAIVWIWIVKCAVTLLIMLPYEHYHSFDSMSYWEQGSKPFTSSDLAYSLGNGTATIITLVKCLNTLIPHSFHAIKILFSFIGICGVFVFYSGTCLLLGPSIKRLLVLGLMPSMVFWTSVLGKDPLVLLGISTFFFGMCRFFVRGKLNGLLIAVIGIIIFSLIRSWLFFIFGGAIVASILLSRLSYIKKILVIGLLVCILPVALEFIPQNYLRVDGMVDQIQQLNSNFSSGGSALIKWQINSWYDLLIAIPSGAFTALFRPLPGDVNNLGGLLAGLENLILLPLFIYALKKIFPLVTKDPILFWVMTTIVVWTVIYSPVSSGNLGTGTRFRTQILPFVLLVILWKPRTIGIHKTEFT